MAIVLALLVALSAACAPLTSPSSRVAGQGAGTNDPTRELVWPAPPETARVRFLYAFGGKKDLDFPVSLFSRLKRLVVGETDHGMVRPYSLAANGDVVAVADPGARAVHHFDMAKKKYKRFTTAGEIPLVSPVGVAVAGDRLHLSDSSTGTVHTLDHKGRHLFSIEGLSRPTGLAFDEKTATLFVADTLEARIDAYDRNGKKLFSFGKRGTEDGAFNYPTHLFLQGETLLVNDTMNFRVQAFDLHGNHLYSFGKHGDGSGQIAQSKGLGMDSEGHVYITDALFDRVQVFDTQGRFLLAFGGSGNADGQFWLPAGLFIDKDRIYVADSYNRRVQVFEFLGSDR